MEICKMLKKGKAYEIYLSKQIAEQMTEITGRKYNERDELILCEVNICPYGLEKMYDQDKKREDNAKDIVRICGLKYIINLKSDTTVSH